MDSVRQVSHWVGSFSSSRMTSPLPPSEDFLFLLPKHLTPIERRNIYQEIVTVRTKKGQDDSENSKILAKLCQRLNLDGKIMYSAELCKLSSSPLEVGLKRVETLLQEGGDPNFCNDCGEFPLHQALDNGNRAIANLLLDHGADPILKNAAGNTAFFIS